MNSLVIALLIPLVVAEPFYYMHPMHPELHPRDKYPEQRTAPRGKIRDLPPSGIIYLNRIKPLDPFASAKAFGSETVTDATPKLPDPEDLTDISSPNSFKILPEEPTTEEVTTTTEKSTTTATKAITPSKDVDLTVAEIAALDELIRDLEVDPIDSKTGEYPKRSHKIPKSPPRLVTLRGAKVSGNAKAVHKRRPGGRLVKLGMVGSTATMKNTAEFDPWERIGQ